ncbi:MAG: Ig-like domain-containing protein, partial [Aquincola sp.]|nr:Ig-like domain-containing protein [Aquincola sp.]
MRHTRLPNAKLAPLAALFLAVAGCGGSSDVSGDPNALQREEAERRYDRTAPTLTITSPSSVSPIATTQSSVQLGGTASDNRQVARVTWISSTGSSGIATLSGKGTSVTWTTAPLPLAAGPNTVTIRAYDRAGNATSESLEVDYS